MTSEVAISVPHQTKPSENNYDEDFETGTYDTLSTESSGSKNKLDPDVAYKIVEELEDWKEKQQEIFLADLLKKEKKHLRFLNSEWIRRRDFLQDNLESGIDKCDALVEDLKKAHQDAMATEIRNREAAERLKRETEEVERFYDAKLIALKEAARRVENDLTHKVKCFDNDKVLIEERLKCLERENGELTDVHIQLHHDIVEFRSTSLKKDQISSLLQQLKSNEHKLADIVKSKSYFKEQWAKTAREVHKMKSKDHLNLNNKLKKCKARIDDGSASESEPESFSDCVDRRLEEIRRHCKVESSPATPNAEVEVPFTSYRSQPNLCSYGVGANFMDEIGDWHLWKKFRSPEQISSTTYSVTNLASPKGEFTLTKTTTTSLKTSKSSPCDIQSPISTKPKKVKKRRPSTCKQRIFRSSSTSSSPVTSFGTSVSSDHSHATYYI